MNRFKISLAVLVALLATAGAAQASSIAVNGTAALNSTNFGLDVNTATPLTPAGGVYVVSSHPNNESHFRVVFRLMIPSTFSMPQTANGNYFRIMNFRRTTSPNVVFVVFVKRSVVNGNYRMNFWYRNDTGTFTNGGEFFLANFGSNVEKKIEIEYTKGNGTGNGQINAKVNDVVQGGFPKTNLNNDDMPVDEVFMGYIQNNGDTACASLVGHYYLDEYESYR